MKSPNAFIYKAEDVVRVIAYIPPGHHHTRVLIEFRDGGKIVLQQTVVDGIIRAYANVALHPQRKAVELVMRNLSKREKKKGFSKHQLLETAKSEEDILREVAEIYSE